MRVRKCGIWEDDEQPLGGLVPSCSSRSSHPCMGIRKVTMGPRRVAQVVGERL